MELSIKWFIRIVENKTEDTVKYKICEREILTKNRVIWEDDFSSSEICKCVYDVLLLPLLHILHSLKEAAK